MEAAHAAPPLAESSLSTPRIEASPWIILIVLALGEFMILLDTTIVSVALPKMSSDLGASLDQLLWVLNAYTLVFAALLITTGRLGDMLGQKRMFLGGLALFTAASAACGLAQTPTQLIIFRIVQAVGGATLMPQTLSIITSIFPPAKRGAAFGVWSAIAGLAAAAGPTLGGVLTSAFSWRAVFFPNVPLGIIALVLAFLIMPEITIHTRRHIDGVGVLLATVGLVGLIFGIIEGQRYNWGRLLGPKGVALGPVTVSLISIPSLLAASVIILAAFVFWEAGQEEPLLPLSLFRDRNYSIGNIVAVAVNFGIMALFFGLTLFLQSVLGLTAFEAGITILPLAIASIITAPISGRLVYRLNGKLLLAAGLVVFGIGIWLVGSVAAVNATGFTFALPLFVAGWGMGMTLAPMTALAMRNMVPSAAGAASGFINTMRQVGSALGVAVAGAVLASRLSTELHSQAVHYAVQLPLAARASFIKGVSSSSSSGLQVGVGQSRVSLTPGTSAALAHHIQALGLTVFNEAFLNALRPSAWVAIPVLVVAALASLVMRTAPLRAALPEAAGAEGRPVPQPTIVLPPFGVSDTIVLPILTATQAIRVRDVRPTRTPYLVQMGDGPQTEYPIRNTLTMGRQPDNQIVVQDPQASRRHAELLFRDGTVVVRDLHSANGTMVNGEPVRGDRPLRDGDTITIGEVSYSFHSEAEAGRPRLVGSDGVEHPLRETMILGRSPASGIVLDDPKASRRHAEVSMRNGQVVLRDLESLNGTEVNGTPIVGDYVLHEGDIIAIGGTEFVYKTDPAVVAA